VHSADSISAMADLIFFDFVFHRSVIAAFLGNAVGALFVAFPAVYFYLSDSHAARLREAETGEVLNERSGSVSSSGMEKGGRSTHVD